MKRYDTMGIILISKDQIPPITDIRANSALPIAGRYRIIDFVLSNMSNAGITNIGVATESNYSSLMDHLKSGKPWDLDRKNWGLNILPPSMEKVSYGQIKGNIDMLAGIRDFILKSQQTYVILSLGNEIYNIDFAQVIEQHIESQADVTVLYKNLAGAEESELQRYNLLEIDDEGRVTDIEVQPYYPKTANAGMDIYVMEKALLESIIDECSARGDSDFVKDALIKKMDGMRVYAAEHKGFASKIDTMKSYYQNNMKFLDAEFRAEMFNPERPIYTKTKDQSPTKYGADAEVENSFISDGCQIDGTVINSVLSRGVKIEKGAVVKNSIIMQDSVIEEGVEIDHVVFDKEVVITKGRKLIGQESYPLAIAKGTII
ncbi:MAG: glucose-1-phosphate adenylyltransferase subunit GlgD [Clostridiales bacterium]|nr:glucose-1-phosphate adenylyltransferase subunit GlgD [Clostridiales bacterium]